MSSTCTIPANSEIAGVGIRISIYAQALLAFIVTGLALFRWAIEHEITAFGSHNRDLENVDPTREEIEYLFRTDIPLHEVLRELKKRYLQDEKEERRDLSQARISVQLTGAALLIAALIQSNLYGLDVYHALIVLDLCWLNNVTALTLYIAEQFLRHPRDRYLSRPFPREFWSIKGLRAAHPFLPTSAYLCGIGAYGLWLFLNLQEIGQTSDFNAQQCNPSILYWILGNPISVTAKGFRIVGIVVHAVACTPLLNLVVEVMIMCWGAIGAQRIIFLPVRLLRRFSGRELSIEPHMVAPEYQNIHFLRTIVALAGNYAFFVIIFILDTEETIGSNASQVGPGENDWTFGQTLVLILLIPVVWDMLERIGAVWRVLNEKRRDDRKVDRAVLKLREERKAQKQLDREGRGSENGGIDGQADRAESKEVSSVFRTVRQGGDSDEKNTA